MTASSSWGKPFGKAAHWGIFVPGNIWVDGREKSHEMCSTFLSIGRRLKRIICFYFTYTFDVHLFCFA